MFQRKSRKVGSNIEQRAEKNEPAVRPKWRVLDDSMSPRRATLLQKAKKYEDRTNALTSGNYEIAKLYFNEALKARLMLFSANSNLVSRCHYKLMQTVYCEGMMRWWNITKQPSIELLNIVIG